MLPVALLRGVLRCDAADGEATLAANLDMLYGELQPEGIDGPILGYVWSLYDRTHAVPDLATVRLYFEGLMAGGDPAGAPALQRLDEVSAQPIALLAVPAFRAALDAHEDDVLQKTTSRVMFEAAHILKTGLQVKDPRTKQTITLKGPKAAIERLQVGVGDLATMFRAPTGARGTLSSDTAHIWRAYEKAKANPGGQYGALSGLQTIDKVHGGLQKGELAFVLGFVGEMKSTFCLNWFYKNSVLYGKRGAYISLETSVEKLRIQLAVLHTQHPKFFKADVPAIEATAVRMGLMTPEQEVIYKAALDDLEQNPDYGAMHYRGADSESITMADVAAYARQLARHDPLDLLVVDYLGLVGSGDKRMQARGGALSEYANLNTAIREAKLLAGAGNDGQGLAILSRLQPARHGWGERSRALGRPRLLRVPRRCAARLEGAGLWQSEDARRRPAA